METKIRKVLKGFKNVKVLKAPTFRKSPDTLSESGEIIYKNAGNYDCTLLVDGKMIAVSFAEGDDIKEKLIKTCKEWKITLSE